jgi:hypothetical protein
MFRFTIRDLLWLMVVVAFGCAWWTTHKKLASRLAESERQLNVAEKDMAAYKLLRRVTVEAGMAPVYDRDGTVTLKQIAKPVPPGSLAVR